MSRTAKDFLIVTFAIDIVLWGGLWALSTAGATMDKYPALYAVWIIGGLSPTIASYIALKRQKRVSGFKEWANGLLGFRRPVWAYLAVAAVIVIAFAPRLVMSEFKTGAPWYLLPVLFLITVLGGGLEEAGWRHILQPELEGKLNFTVAALIVSAIWAVWHLPLFYIPGVGQYGSDYAVFCVGTVGISFALAAVKRKTGSTGLCILTHALMNTVSSYLIIENDG